MFSARFKSGWQDIERRRQKWRFRPREWRVRFDLVSPGPRGPSEGGKPDSIIHGRVRAVHIHSS